MIAFYPGRIIHCTRRKKIAPSISVLHFWCLTKVNKWKIKLEAALKLKIIGDFWPESQQNLHNFKASILQDFSENENDTGKAMSELSALVFR